jgi:DNA-binding transcriptional LysR family regulator
MIEAISENKLDCGVLVCPANFEEKGFAIIPLAQFQDVMIVSPVHQKLTEKPISLKTISGYPLIGLSPDTLTSQTLQEYFSQNQRNFNPDIERDTTDLIVPAVENNLGIGIVPEAFAQNALANKRVFQLDLIEKIPRRNICLIYKLGQPHSMAVEAFISCVKNLHERESNL